MENTIDVIDLPYPRDFLPKQWEVLDAVEKYRYILYSGAYGAGKTLLLSHIIIQQCINYPRSLWFAGSQTVPMLRDTFVRTFLEELEMYQEKLRENKIHLFLEKSWKPSIMSFTFFNDSEVLFRSCDEPTKFKSLNLDGFAIDEPVDISEEVFKMLQGRLRASHTKHHMGVMAGNPSGFTNWVYRRFFEEKTDEYFVVHTTTYDNTYLQDDYIKSMESSYDDDYIKRYLKGEWGSFEGLVYKDFSYKKHVGDYRDTSVKYYIGGYDDGYRNPACLITLGIDADNKIYVVDEFYKNEKTSPEIAKSIDNLNKRFPYRRIYADPSAVQAIEAMKNVKLPVVDGNNKLEPGVAKLKGLFKHDWIFIDKNCKNLLKELESYRYEKDKFTRNFSEKPIAKDDHACDALRYGITEFNPYKTPTIMGAGHFAHQVL